jgi:hypothetical protein
MDDAGKFSHALYAVLYAARNTGCDLDKLVHTIKRDIVGHNSIRPLPQDQATVIRAVEDAINDISR